MTIYVIYEQLDFFESGCRIYRVFENKEEAVESYTRILLTQLFDKKDLKCLNDKSCLVLHKFEDIDDNTYKQFLDYIRITDKKNEKVISFIQDVYSKQPPGKSANIIYWTAYDVALKIILISLYDIDAKEADPDDLFDSISLLEAYSAFLEESVSSRLNHIGSFIEKTFKDKVRLFIN